MRVPASLTLASNDLSLASMGIVFHSDDYCTGTLSVRKQFLLFVVLLKAKGPGDEEEEV